MKKLFAITLLTILSTVCIFAQHGTDEEELIGLGLMALGLFCGQAP
jgi:hypothetical protein